MTLVEWDTACCRWNKFINGWFVVLFYLTILWSIFWVAKAIFT